jgi:predicted nucleotidyltransferase
MDRGIPFMDQVVNTIVSTVNPEKIILFGSYARGDYEKDSDIDLLILKKGLKNEREVANDLYLKFFNQKISVPIDIIAVDYDKYYQLNDDVGYIYKTIKREGKVVYE